MRRIALINQKGGVGKTTTAVNLSASLARLGRRVLLVDLDPQANATLALGLIPGSVPRTVYELLFDRAKAADVIQNVRPGLDLVPSKIDLAGAELDLAGAIGRESALKDCLAGVNGYDFVLVDCPPSLGLLNINALTFVDEVFIPLQCEFFALQGISHLLKTLEMVQRRLNPTLHVSGVIACMVNTRTSLSREVLEDIGRYFKDKLFKTHVRMNVRLAEAPSHGKSIIEYAPKSPGAQDYTALAREVVGLPLEETPAVPAITTEAAVPVDGAGLSPSPPGPAHTTVPGGGVRAALADAAPPESPPLPTP